MSFQIIYEKRRYNLELLYLSDSRFAVSIDLINKIPIKFHPLYRKLL